MMRTEKSRSNCKTHGQCKKTNKSNQNPCILVRTRAIIKMNAVNPGEHVSSKDQEEEAAVEIIHTYNDGYQKDILHLQEAVHPIRRTIQPIEEGKWKKLAKSEQVL